MNNFYDSFLYEKQIDEYSWYDYEMYYGGLMAEEEIPEEHDDYMQSCY